MTEVKKGHLTEEERDLITILYAQYKSIRQIAREIRKNPATVSRELFSILKFRILIYF